MNSGLKNNYVSLTKILTIPIFLAFSAYFYFQNSLYHISPSLVESGKVAGERDERISNLSEIFPIIPGSVLISYDESDNTKSLTLEVRDGESQVNKFYKDYLTTQGWEQINRKAYQKENMKMKVEVEGNIILLNLQYDNPNL